MAVETTQENNQLNVPNTQLTHNSEARSFHFHVHWKILTKPGFPLPLVTDENKTSTGESKTPAIVTLAN
jgi:hypothetical protein